MTTLETKAGTNKAESQTTKIESAPAAEAVDKTETAALITE